MGLDFVHAPTFYRPQALGVGSCQPWSASCLSHLHATGGQDELDSQEHQGDGGEPKVL